MTSTPIIRDLDAGGAGDEAAWSAFVEAQPEATFFHRPEWRRAIGKTFGYDCYFRAAWEGDRLTGILPLVHVRTPLLGSSLCSLAFFVRGGIVAETEAAGSALLADAEALGERLRVDYIELRSERAAVRGWAIKGGTYATFRAGIDPDPDVRLKAIPRKKRADVRKAIKLAPPVDTDISIETFHSLYSRTMRDHGTPIHARRWYRAIQETFGDAVEISAVRGANGPVAALMSFHFRDQVMPYYVGALPEARAVHAMDYIYWTQMERATARGARVFDFGRSKVGTGAFDYKTHWGFAPTPLAYQYRLFKAEEAPDVNPNNPRYRFFVENWRRLPLWAADRAGPFFARQLA